MAVSRAFTLYAANINTVLIDQIESFNYDAGLQKLMLRVDGSVDPTYIAIGNQSPRISLTTSKIATALGLCSIGGLAMTAGTFFFQQIASGGTRATGSSHTKLAATTGFVIPRRLSAQLNQPATIEYDVICLSNAGAAPITATKSQALAGTPDADECYVAGKVAINGTALSGVQSISIDFGITEIVMSGDGDVYPSFAAVMSRQPRITIEVPDTDLLADFGTEGDVQGATDSIVYLRKVSEGGTRVADETEEHISLTIDDGHVSVDSANASTDQPATASVMIDPVFDGTNDILVIDTTAAIA